MDFGKSAGDVFISELFYHVFLFAFVFLIDAFMKDPGTMILK